MNLSVEINYPKTCIPLGMHLYTFYNGRIPTACGIVLLNPCSTERYILTECFSASPCFQGIAGQARNDAGDDALNKAGYE